MASSVIAMATTASEKKVSRSTARASKPRSPSDTTAPLPLSRAAWQVTSAPGAQAAVALDVGSCDRAVPGPGQRGEARSDLQEAQNAELSLPIGHELVRTRARVRLRIAAPHSSPEALAPAPRPARHASTRRQFSRNES